MYPRYTLLNPHTPKPCFSILLSSTGGTRALRIPTLLARQISVMSLSPTIQTRSYGVFPIALLSSPQLKGFLCSVQSILIPAAQAGSPTLTLFEITIIFTCISWRVLMQEATCSDAGRNQCSLVRVSSLSKMISSACFIRTRRGSSVMEERSQVGLKRDGVKRKSKARRSICRAKIYQDYMYGRGDQLCSWGFACECEKECSEVYIQFILCWFSSSFKMPNLPFHFRSDFSNSSLSNLSLASINRRCSFSVYRSAASSSSLCMMRLSQLMVAWLCWIFYQNCRMSLDQRYREDSCSFWGRDQRVCPICESSDEKRRTFVWKGVSCLIWILCVGRILVMTSRQDSINFTVALFKSLLAALNCQFSRINPSMSQPRGIQPFIPLSTRNITHTS